jgi:hypothetical protein
MDKNYNTKSLVGSHSGSGSPANEAINTTLSTQIIIKVNGEPVGALQKLTVSQKRPLERIKEVGTDGVIEIVPNGATEFTLTADRIVFDQLRLPESFSRGFRFINAQRLPFDIEVLDISNTDPGSPTDDKRVVSMVYRNCWFESYDTPYEANNYIVTESATIQCETAYLSASTGEEETQVKMGLRGITPETDNASIEKNVNAGTRRGSMDTAGIINSVFYKVTEQ